MAGRSSELIKSLVIRQRYGPFIRGKFVPGAGGEIPVHNPANGQVLATVSSTSQDQASEAIAQANDAFNTGTWSRAPSLQRSIVLTKLARSLERHIPQLAEIESLQTGRTIREMRAQLGRLPEWLDYYAALLRTHSGFVAPTQGQLLNYVNRIPLGVVVQITPFNHPLLIALKKLAPALAAGNSVIIKPSEQAPLSVLEFAELATEAGIPPSVLTVLTGTGETLGRTLVTNSAVKKVDVTAGTRTGRAIGSLAGANLASYTAELGGKAPILVFEDADIPSAVNGVAFASFIASGQTCVSATRLLVHENIYDRFMESFILKVKAITQGMGNPLHPQSTMGSLISFASLERILEVLSRCKGRILIGGNRMTGTSSLDGFDFSEGSFFEPTIVDNITSEDEIWQEEIFGPVLAVIKFKDEADGIALANNCKYGLGSGVWTQDLSRAHRVAARLESGLVWINTHHKNDPSSPWGGLKESGIGRENGIEAFESYSQSKSVIINIASVDDTRSTDDWFNVDSTRRYG
ncbi:aldehyde dehydrogenase [Serendipita vermifera]|nr:aldehyde dehydrogenase [Serendipita vermifera]